VVDEGGICKYQGRGWKTFGLKNMKYRGSHGNLRLWRVCKAHEFLEVSCAVLVEAGSSLLYRREYVH